MKHIVCLICAVFVLCMTLSGCYDQVSIPETYDYATDFGIGYGYDVLNSPYFEAGQVKKRNSILNLEEAANLIGKTQQSSSTSEGICASSIEEYLQEYQKRLQLDFEISTEFSVFSSSVGLAFDVSGSDFLNQKFSSNEQQIFYTYFDDIDAYYLEMKNYDREILQGMLSDFFLKDIKRESSDTKVMSDEELATYLMAKYGTHLITGVQLGGRLEYSYVISTSGTEQFTEYESALNLAFEGGATELLKSKVEGSEQSALETLLTQSNAKSDFTIRRYGGASTGLWTYEELQKNYSDWAKSLNDAEHLNAVGIAPDGMVALWTLIPDEYTGLIEAMQRIYRQNGLAVYNTNLEKYRPVEASSIEVVDLTPYYDTSRSTEGAVALYDFSHPNYNKETGVFSAYGQIDGREIKQYIFKGSFGLLDNNGQVVKLSLQDFAIRVASEHDIEIILQNISFTAPSGAPAVYTADGIQNQSMTVTLISSGEASQLSTGEQNVIKGYSDSENRQLQGTVAIDIDNLIVTGDAALKICGGNGVDGSDAWEDACNYHPAKEGESGLAGIRSQNLTISSKALLEIYGGSGGDGGCGVNYGTFVDGMAGGNGGWGVKADAVTVERSEDAAAPLKIVGGSGGHGGDGGHGITGASGVTSSKGKGNGTDGSNGYTGGHGGSGGHGVGAILCTALSGQGYVELYGGNGGNGGNGGEGGRGGDGGAGAVKEEFTIIGDDPANGGDGGDGGKGGDAGLRGAGANAYRVEQTVDMTFAIMQKGSTGELGKAGPGGDPGLGGAAGKLSGMIDTKTGKPGTPGDPGAPGSSNKNSSEILDELWDQIVDALK